MGSHLDNGFIHTAWSLPQVTLHEARDLPVWGFPWQSNPYCRITLGAQAVQVWAKCLLSCCALLCLLCMLCMLRLLRLSSELAGGCDLACLDRLQSVQSFRLLQPAVNS